MSPAPPQGLPGLSSTRGRALCSVHATGVKLESPNRPHGAGLGSLSALKTEPLIPRIPRGIGHVAPTFGPVRPIPARSMLAHRAYEPWIRAERVSPAGPGVHRMLPWAERPQSRGGPVPRLSSERGARQPRNLVATRMPPIHRTPDCAAARFQPGRPQSAQSRAARVKRRRLRDSSRAAPRRS